MGVCFPWLTVPCGPAPSSSANPHLLLHLRSQRHSSKGERMDITALATSPVVDTATLVLIITQLAKAYVPAGDNQTNNIRVLASTIGVLVYTAVAVLQPAHPTANVLFTAAAQGLLVGFGTTFGYAGAKTAVAKLPSLSVSASAPADPTPTPPS